MPEGPPGRPKLRDLARAHAQGELHSDDYRRARGQLLDRLTADEEPTERIPAALPASSLPTPPPPAPAPARRRRRHWIPVALVGSMIVLAIGAMLITNRERPVPPLASVPDPGRTATAQQETAAPRDALDTLMESFRNHDDWGQRSLANFLARWESLPAVAREQGRRSPAFKYLAEDLLRRIDTLRAARGTARQAELAALESFARHLGIGTPPAAPQDSLTGHFQSSQRTFEKP